MMYKDNLPAKSVKDTVCFDDDDDDDDAAGSSTGGVVSDVRLPQCRYDTDDHTKKARDLGWEQDRRQDSIHALTNWNQRPDIQVLREIESGGRLIKPGQLEYFVSRGLVRHADTGRGLMLTPAGTGFVLAADAGVMFFDVCVLAKVHGITYRIYGLDDYNYDDADDNHNVCCRRAPAAASYIHQSTIARCFDCWTGSRYKIRIALARLRHRGLLPRAPYKKISCDLACLSGIRRELFDLEKWVDETCEAVQQSSFRQTGI